MKHIILEGGESFNVSNEHGSWNISYDPGWGIKITPIGASVIPKCFALVERPDLVARQLKEGE